MFSCFHIHFGRLLNILENFCRTKSHVRIGSRIFQDATETLEFHENSKSFRTSINLLQSSYDFINVFQITVNTLETLERFYDFLEYFR